MRVHFWFHVCWCVFLLCHFFFFYLTSRESLLYTREEVSSAFSEFLIAMKQQETTILWASKSHKVHRTLGASIRLMCSAIFPLSSSLFFFCPLLCHVLCSYYLASFHDNCAKGKGSLKKKKTLLMFALNYVLVNLFALLTCILRSVEFFGYWISFSF